MYHQCSSFDYIRSETIVPNRVDEVKVNTRYRAYSRRILPHSNCLTGGPVKCVVKRSVHASRAAEPNRARETARIQCYYTGEFSLERHEERSSTCKRLDNAGTRHSARSLKILCHLWLWHCNVDCSTLASHPSTPPSPAVVAKSKY